MAEYACISALDSAMEQAWLARNDWQEMGRTATVHVRREMARDPVSEFAAQIREWACEK
jgi:hypothetical protein